MGLITTPVDRLRVMLSKCYALQNWQGETYTEAELLDRIYLDALPDPDDGASRTKEESEALRPFILIGADVGSPLTIRKVAGGGGNWFDSSGTINVYVEQNAVGDTESEIDRAFQVTMEQTLKTNNQNQPGLLDQVDLPGSLNISSIIVMGPYRIDHEEVEEMGDCQMFRLQVRWGQA